MKFYTEKMERMIKQIEQETPALKASEWAWEYVGYIKDSLDYKVESQDIIDFLRSIIFYISADNDVLFREIKTEFNDVYADIDFEYSVNNGIQFSINPSIVDILDENNEKQVFEAVEELIPEQLDSIKLQWTFWTTQQKRDFIAQLEDDVIRKIHLLREKIEEPFFEDYENNIKQKIIVIANNELAAHSN